MVIINLYEDDIGGSARYVFKFYTDKFTITQDGRIYIAWPHTIPYRVNRENVHNCFFITPDSVIYERVFCKSITDQTINVYPSSVIENASFCL